MITAVMRTYPMRATLDWTYCEEWISVSGNEALEPSTTSITVGGNCRADSLSVIKIKLKIMH